MSYAYSQSDEVQAFSNELHLQRNRPKPANPLKRRLCWAGLLLAAVVIGYGIGQLLPVSNKSDCTESSNKAPEYREDATNTFYKKSDCATEITKSRTGEVTTKKLTPTLPPLYWINSVEFSSNPENGTTSCTSSECLLHAAKLLYGINPSLDPCDDFYAFACGRKIEETVVSIIATKSSDFRDQQQKINSRVKDILNSGGYERNSVLTKAVRMYEVCLAQGESMLSMKRALEDISGGWPLAVGTLWDLSHRITNFNDLIPILGKLSKYRQNGFLFTMGVLPDMKNTSRYLPMIVQPDREKMLPLSEGFMFEINFARILSNLANSLAPSQVTITSVLSETRGILNMNELIYNAIKPEDPNEEDYQVLTFEQFEKLTGNSIKWLDYTNSVFSGIRTMKPTDVIGVRGLDYFKTMANVLQRQFLKDQKTGRTIVNYEILRLLLLTNRHSTHKLYRSNTEALIQLLSSPPRIPDDTPLERKLFCDSTTAEWFSYAIAQKYAERHMNVSAAVEVSKEITSYIIKSFEDQLHTLDWLDEKSRSGALDKIRLMKQNYNFPQWVKDPTKLKKFYEEANGGIVLKQSLGMCVTRTKVKLSVGSDHIESLLNYLRFTMQRNYRQIYASKSTDSLLPWEMDPLTVNAYYKASDNSLTLLQSILQPPMFGADRLKVMNFAAFGSIIGHEVAHGFEAEGQKRDGRGNLADWMGKTARERFVTKEKCFKEQYSAYSLTSADIPGLKRDLKVNASKTMDENVADTAGLQNTYRAYKKWEDDHGSEVLPETLRKFSNDQVFFISYAHAWCSKYGYFSDDLEEAITSDDHSPDKFRVLGSLRNFEEFAKVFKCRPHHKMNPKTRCNAW